MMLLGWESSTSVWQKSAKFEQGNFSLGGVGGNPRLPTLYHINRILSGSFEGTNNTTTLYIRNAQVEPCLHMQLQIEVKQQK